MIEVVLTGRLGKKFGRSFNLEVASPLEAVRAFCYMIDGFEAELRKGAYRLIRKYANGSKIGHTEKDLGLQFGRAVQFRIEPAAKGSKSGFWSIILGAILIGAAFIFTGGALAGTAFSVFGMGVTGSQLALTGGLLALSGVASMLAPTLKQDPNSTNEPSSFMINTPDNWAEQGHPVPLCYGRVFVGSIVIDNGITTEDYIPDDSTD